jgi:hypothetical protein
MIRAACHCTAIRFELAATPESVLDCNCTICRRYGALWAYPDAEEVTFVRGADATDAYVWGDGELAFHRCRVCGCVTHMVAVKEDPPRVYGINARMIATLDPVSVRLVQKDNGHTGFFWTRSESAPESSHHPKMDLPGPDDWR